jgi:hypothetical protein
MKIRFMCMEHYCDLNPDDEEQMKSGSLLDCVLGNGDGTYEFDFSFLSCPDSHELNRCAERWTVVVYDNFTMPGPKGDTELKMADNGKNFIKVEEG